VRKPKVCPTRFRGATIITHLSLNERNYFSDYGTEGIKKLNIKFYEGFTITKNLMNGFTITTTLRFTITKQQ
jgi:hypothetical protein